MCVTSITTTHEVAACLKTDSNHAWYRMRFLGADVIAKIRHCANKGLILGTEKFRQQFEEITGDSPTPIDE